MKHTLLMALSALAFSTTLPAASLVEDPLPDPAGLAINCGRMISFAHPLPRMKNGKAACGLYNNPEWSVPGLLSAQDSRLGLFLQRLRETITANRRLLFIDGRVIVCNHNWIRDHVQQMKGWMHWERDPLAFLQFIIDTQRPDGQYYELVKQLDDVHWKFVPRDCRILYPEDNLSLVRLELEADVEYLVVEGAMHVYRMTGDDRWLASVLPRLEKGIDYQTSDPKRWDAETRLCIRPYTIDTWDFTTEARSSGDRSIHPDETMCAMHGDNTGVYQAMSQLAWFNDRLGNSAKASEWRRRAEALKADIMKTLWNGRRIKITITTGVMRVRCVFDAKYRRERGRPRRSVKVRTQARYAPGRAVSPRPPRTPRRGVPTRSGFALPSWPLNLLHGTLLRAGTPAFPSRHPPFHQKRMIFAYPFR